MREGLTWTPEVGSKGRNLVTNESVADYERLCLHLFGDATIVNGDNYSWIINAGKQVGPPSRANGDRIEGFCMGCHSDAIQIRVYLCVGLQSEPH
jgi:hypothetical protein